MTGPDHYREAEALLNAAGVATASQAYASVQLDEPPSPLIAAAQVHATLAVAAALGALKEPDRAALNDWYEE